MKVSAGLVSPEDGTRALEKKRHTFPMLSARECRLFRALCVYFLCGVGASRRQKFITDRKVSRILPQIPVDPLTDAQSGRVFYEAPARLSRGERRRVGGAVAGGGLLQSRGGGFRSSDTHP